MSDARLTVTQLKDSIFYFKTHPTPENLQLIPIYEKEIANRDSFNKQS